MTVPFYGHQIEDLFLAVRQLMDQDFDLICLQSIQILIQAGDAV